jgi:hypothetical protein
MQGDGSAPTKVFLTSAASFPFRGEAYNAEYPRRKAARESPGVLRSVTQLLRKLQESALRKR